jgi:hypothetical protein
LPRLQARLLLAFVLLINVIAACGGGGDETPAPDENVPPAEGASLDCTQECRDRGQCGESEDRGTVVLMSLDQPAVSAIDHDLAVPTGSPVEVREQRPVTLVENATGLEFPVNFFRVFVPNRNVEAWVAEWCVFNAPLPQ